MKRSDLPKIVHQLVLTSTDDGICRVAELPAPPTRRRISVFTTNEVHPSVIEDVQRAVIEHSEANTTVDLGFSFIRVHKRGP